jgi:hypothetical protein
MKTIVGLVAAFGLVAASAAAQGARLVTVTGCLQSHAGVNFPLVLTASTQASHATPVGTSGRAADGAPAMPGAMMAEPGATYYATAEADMNLTPYMGHVVEATGYAMPFVQYDGTPIVVGEEPINPGTRPGSSVIDPMHWYLNIGTALKVVGPACGAR